MVFKHFNLLNSLTLFRITIRTFYCHGNFSYSAEYVRKVFSIHSLSLSYQSFSFILSFSCTREDAFSSWFSFILLSHSLPLTPCLGLSCFCEIFNSIIHSHSVRVSRNIREGGRKREKSLFFIISSSASFLPLEVLLWEYSDRVTVTSYITSTKRSII